MRLAALIVLVLMASCASKSQIVSLPSGHLLATGFASSLEGGSGGARKAALELAARHCKASDKRVEVIEISLVDVDVMKGGAVDVEFTCVSDA